ncbi:MAG: hypothetical protein KBD78_03665 [Oligoflexales bacterium]|nr:hypothetical protein [Oligoflexales bacterium]
MMVNVKKQLVFIIMALPILSCSQQKGSSVPVPTGNGEVIIQTEPEAELEVKVPKSEVVVSNEEKNRQPEPDRTKNENSKPNESTKENDPVYYDKLRLVNESGGAIVGNGGDAVICLKDDTNEVISVQLLDFYEAKYRWIFNLDLDQAGTSVEEKLDYVIKKLSKHDPVRAKVYKEQIDTFHANTNYWPGIRLHNIKDANEIGIPKGCVVGQVARQHNSSLAFDKYFVVAKDIYDLMDNNNKAGLILHEIIYKEMIARGAKESSWARQMTALLSSENFSEVSREQHLKLLGDANLSYEIESAALVVQPAKDKVLFGDNAQIQKIEVGAEENTSILIGEQKYFPKAGTDIVLSEGEKLLSFVNKERMTETIESAYITIFPDSKVIMTDGRIFSKIDQATLVVNDLSCPKDKIESEVPEKIKASELTFFESGKLSSSDKGISAICSSKELNYFKSLRFLRNGSLYSGVGFGEVQKKIGSFNYDSAYIISSDDSRIILHPNGSLKYGDFSNSLGSSLTDSGADLLVNEKFAIDEKGYLLVNAIDKPIFDAVSATEFNYKPQQGKFVVSAVGIDFHQVREIEIYMGLKESELRHAVSLNGLSQYGELSYYNESGLAFQFLIRYIFFNRQVIDTFATSSEIVEDVLQLKPEIETIGFDFNFANADGFEKSNSDLELIFQNSRIHIGRRHPILDYFPKPLSLKLYVNRNDIHMEQSLKTRITKYRDLYYPETIASYVHQTLTQKIEPKNSWTLDLSEEVQYPDVIETVRKLQINDKIIGQFDYNYKANDIFYSETTLYDQDAKVLFQLEDGVKFIECAKDGVFDVRSYYVFICLDSEQNFRYFEFSNFTKFQQSLKTSNFAHIENLRNQYCVLAVNYKPKGDFIHLHLYIKDDEQANIQGYSTKISSFGDPAIVGELMLNDVIPLLDESSKDLPEYKNLKINSNLFYTDKSNFAYLLRNKESGVEFIVRFDFDSEKYLYSKLSGEGYDSSQESELELIGDYLYFKNNNLYFNDASWNKKGQSDPEFSRACSNSDNYWLYKLPNSKEFEIAFDISKNKKLISGYQLVQCDFFNKYVILRDEKEFFISTPTSLYNEQAPLAAFKLEFLKSEEIQESWVFKIGSREKDSAMIIHILDPESGLVTSEVRYFSNLTRWNRRLDY